jgi:hypothetical protein
MAKIKQHKPAEFRCPLCRSAKQRLDAVIIREGSAFKATICRECATLVTRVLDHPAEP